MRIALPILAAFALASCASERLPCEDRDAAFDAANALILDRLKAPATATFPKIGDKGVIAEWEEVDPEKGKCGFYVSAYVDSENSFGAKIRERYMIHTYNIGVGEWMLADEPFFFSSLE